MKSNGFSSLKTLPDSLFCNLLGSPDFKEKSTRTRFTPYCLVAYLYAVFRLIIVAPFSINPPAAMLALSRLQSYLEQKLNNTSL
jgi:hypothetical protein